MAVPFHRDMLNIVHKIAGQQHRLYPVLDYDDLFQEGCIGLIEGLKKADNTPTWKTYVSYRIKFRMTNYIRKQTAEMRDIKSTFLASDLADDYDWFERNCEANNNDLNIPTIRKTIMFILTPKLRDTYKQYFILGRTSDEIGKDRGMKTGQGILEQVWKIEYYLNNFFNLKEHDINRIRRISTNGSNSKEYKNFDGLAAEYGVTKKAISLLSNRSNKRYNYSLGITSDNIKKRTNKYFSMDDIAKIREEWGGGCKKGGKSTRTIAKEWCVNDKTIRNIVHNKTYMGY